MTTLLPRLSSVDACRRMAALKGLAIDDVVKAADEALHGLPVWYAATGGARLEVASPTLLSIRRELREIASRSGYPEKIDRDGKQAFDTDVAFYLREVRGLCAGEGVRAETWQFMAAGLVPDLVFWRWAPGEPGGSVTEARYLGGNRNCLGRLWQRATVFWDERLANPGVLIRLLREDNFVAILERSAFSAFAFPCREVARAFLLRRSLARDAAGNSLEEKLLRDSMCRIVRATGYSAPWALGEAQLRGLVSHVFDSSLNAMGLVPVDESILLTRQEALRLFEHSKFEDRSVVLTKSQPQRSKDLSTPSHVANAPGPARAFEKLTGAERAGAVWAILIGYGEAPEDELVRVAASVLREERRLVFERLREGGLVYRRVQKAIQRGVHLGTFDKPSRGKRRAVISNAEQLPAKTVQAMIRASLSVAVPAHEAFPRCVDRVGDLVGTRDKNGTNRMVEQVFVAMRESGEIVTANGGLDLVAVPKV